MEQVIRSNIGKLLTQVITAIKRNDSFKLKELSNANVSSAAVFQDEDSLLISVAIYALSKIIDHSNKKKLIVANLEKASGALAASNDERYRFYIRDLMNSIKIEDSRLRKFVSNVIEQAEVKKGCSLCENGLSIGRAANLLGISRWELMGYLGNKNAAEQSSENIPTEKRLDTARRIFS